MNCLKAREKYKNFEVSSEDILRNVALPNLDYQIAVLLGIYRGRGNLNLKGKGVKKRYALQLSGNSKNDFDFYENYVKDAIKKAHNLEVKIHSVMRVRELNGKEYEAFYPLIEIDSKMIYTWLKDDLGFPQFPNIKWNDELEEGFFDGIMASKGALKKSGAMVLTESDFEFGKDFVNLSERLGFTPRFSPSEVKIKGKKYQTYKISFSRNEIKRMNLINPKHQLRA